MTGVRKVIAKLAMPQIMTEIAAAWARAVVGKSSVGINQTVASQPIPKAFENFRSDLDHRDLCVYGRGEVRFLETRCRGISKNKP